MLYTAFLNAQGRFLHDAFLYATGEAILYASSTLVLLLEAHTTWMWALFQQCILFRRGALWHTGGCGQSPYASSHTPFENVS